MPIHINMSVRSIPSGSIKFAIGWVVVFLVRLIPFRPPNIEPVLTTMMPFAKRYGWFGVFVFGFLSIAIYDAATGFLGIWTVITGAAYGFVGIGAAVFFRRREATATNFLGYAIIGTIAYDALTGLTVGPIAFDQPFLEALVGQIPFTILHLLGNVVFAVTVSPAIYRWVVANPKFEASAVVRALGFVKA